MRLARPVRGSWKALCTRRCSAVLRSVISDCEPAIRAGAPAYNEGNVKKCFDVYAQTAMQLIDARIDCPGVQQALKAGLTRAQSMGDVDHQAWAMRDTFDGLLSVIEKFLRTGVEQTVSAASKKSGKRHLPN